MVYLSSPASIDEAMTNAFSQLLGGIMSLMAIGWVIGLIFLIATVALITWVVKKVWYAGRNRKYRSQNRKWRKFQKKEEKRERQQLAEYEYYQKHQAKKNRKEWEKQQKKEKPDPSKGFENNPDWYWDDAAQLWRYKGKGQKQLSDASSGTTTTQKRYSPTGWYYDEKRGLWISPEEAKKEAKK